MAKPRLVHVPTVAELAAEGLATLVELPGKPARTVWKVKKKGYVKIHTAEVHNAAILKPLVDDVAAKRATLDKATARLEKMEATRP